MSCYRSPLNNVKLEGFLAVSLINNEIIVCPCSFSKHKFPLNICFDYIRWSDNFFIDKMSSTKKYFSLGKYEIYGDYNTIAQKNVCLIIFSVWMTLRLLLDCFVTRISVYKHNRFPPKRSLGLWASLDPRESPKTGRERTFVYIRLSRRHTLNFHRPGKKNTHMH